jgi:hypothetical protein
MPSPTKGVPVELDRTRHLRFPLGVLRGIEADTQLATVMYLGLKHEDPELTVEQVGEMIDLEMMPGLVEPLKIATGGLVDAGVLFGFANTNGAQAEGGAEGNAAETPAG